MTILAQHGYAKSDKIQQGIDDGSVSGVIMSPRDEQPANFAAFVSALPEDVERMADPQFYVGTILGARDGNLPQYAHYIPNLIPASFSPGAITQYVTNTLVWQSSLAVSAVLSPTVMVDTFNNRWAPNRHDVGPRERQPAQFRNTFADKLGDRRRSIEGCVISRRLAR